MSGDSSDPFVYAMKQLVY